MSMFREKNHDICRKPFIHVNTGGSSSHVELMWLESVSLKRFRLAYLSLIEYDIAPKQKKPNPLPNKTAIKIHQLYCITASMIMYARMALNTWVTIPQKWYFSLLFFTCSKSDGIMRDANKGDKSWFVPLVCPYVDGFCCILTVQ